MIKTRKELKAYLQEDYKYYQANGVNKFKHKLASEHLQAIWKYIKFLRHEEYYTNKKNFFYKPIQYYYMRRKNMLGNKLGFYILPNCLEKGITICHHGNIIINGYSRIGKNCILHGDNCLGNNGKDKKAPTLGNNIDVGIGAKIIGDVYIADNVKIGANAVVVKSCYTKGATLIGIPAREIEKNE